MDIVQWNFAFYFLGFLLCIVLRKSPYYFTPGKKWEKKSLSKWVPSVDVFHVSNCVATDLLWEEMREEWVEVCLYSKGAHPQSGITRTYIFYGISTKHIIHSMKTPWWIVEMAAEAHEGTLSAYQVGTYFAPRKARLQKHRLTSKSKHKSSANTM